jgi:HK97 family phage prohead protease
MKLITVDKFRGDLRSGRDPDHYADGVFRVTAEPVRKVEGAARTKRFVFSDETVDRMGDKIFADGWDLANFQKNSVALWAHDSSSPPIGRASNLTIESGRLLGDIEFAPPETYAFAETIWRLVDGGFIRAVSVGFLPKKYAFVEDDSSRKWGVDFLEQELLEISLCPIPANPAALLNARSKGIDLRPLAKWAEHALEGTDTAVIPKAQLQRLQKLAKEKPPMATRKKPAQRAAGEDDPTGGGDVIGNCGRDKDETCGMKDPGECATHADDGDKKVDPDDEKALLRALKKLNPKYKDVDDGSDDSDGPPMAHEDAIRMAHKNLRTSKAFLTDAAEFHTKALDLLKPVVDAMNEENDDTDVGDGGQPKADDEGEKDEDEDGDEKDPDTKAAKAALKKAQIALAAALTKKHRR